MVLINTQSIKSKEHIIMEYLMDKQVDLAILTETWLCEDDDTWVKAYTFKCHILDLSM